MNFIFGILFILVALPILQQFSDLIVTLMEAWKSKINLTIAGNNFEISKMRIDCEEKNAIGFSINKDPESEDYYDGDGDDDDEEEDKISTIGFMNGGEIK